MNTTQPRWTRIGFYTLAVLALCTAFALWGELTSDAGAWHPVEPAVAVLLGYGLDAAQRRRAARRSPAA